MADTSAKAAAVATFTSPTLAGVTGLVLAGGQGSRMGGVDKGLLNYQGVPLALNALQRLHQQQGATLAACLVNANRHLDTYQSWGVPVLTDALADFPGPLAGFEVGLAHSATPYVLTVPCDSPRFPLDLLASLAHALDATQADLAVASAREAPDAPLRTQPVFCLLHTRLLNSLRAYTRDGGRKIDTWIRQQHAVTVPFDRPGDVLAFANANTPAQLQALQAPPTPDT